jgi:hypothetical protein
MAEVPCIELGYLTPLQRQAYVIADNKLALNAGWDDKLLALELKGLGDAGFDLALTGFSLAEIRGFGGGAGLTDPDEAPEIEASAISRPADLWLLGEHRLLCGDCTVPTDVEKVLAGAVPHLMVTDPPYGVEYDPDWRNRADRANGKPYGARAIGRVENDDRSDWSAAFALFAGDVVYSWSPAGSPQIDHYNALAAAGFQIRMQIIWAKSHFPVGRGDYHVQHESCWYAVDRDRADLRCTPPSVRRS